LAIKDALNINCITDYSTPFIYFYSAEYRQAPGFIWVMDSINSIYWIIPNRPSDPAAPEITGLKRYLNNLRTETGQRHTNQMSLE